jgi:exonuclease I
MWGKNSNTTTTTKQKMHVHQKQRDIFQMKVVMNQEYHTEHNLYHSNLNESSKSTLNKLRP